MEKWGYGKAFGQISMHTLDISTNLENFVFPSWKPWIWNSFCFIADSVGKTLKAYLNNKFLHQTSYHDQHKHTNSVILMNSEFGNREASGDVTDVQIWSKKLSAEGISIFIFIFHFSQLTI